MLKLLRYSDPGFDRELVDLLARSGAPDNEIEQSVSTIISRVRSGGDSALLDYTREFDHFDIDQAGELELSRDDIERNFEKTDDIVIEALEFAAARIRRFHEKETLESWSYEESSGTLLGQKITPLGRVGVYVPGGRAAYPSTVLMTVIPARVAGVGEIIMSVPVPGGEFNSSVIAAARIAGVDRIFTIGGAQAIAAMAYGTESVPRVDKIVGPGNTYVATAKKQVFGDVGIDMIAGPSEVVVICDETADPEWVAMDMFAQAEHDELAQSIAITNSGEVAKQVKQAIARMLPDMERKEIIRSSLESHGAIILVDSLTRAVEISNRIAPEHLELMVANPDDLLVRIHNAGSIFSGRYSAEVLGDYCAGPNHVLPTAGTARFSSPLGVYDFQKRSSILQASEAGADEMARIAAVLADCEGLTAHAASARYRFRKSQSSD
jgi:histidinol dehydrogenase